MKRTWRRLGERLLCVTVVWSMTVVAVGCDDDGDGKDDGKKSEVELEIERRTKANAEKKKKQGSAAATGLVKITYENKSWTGDDTKPGVAIYFRDYQTAQVSNKNAFSPNANTFIERPKLPDAPEGKEGQEQGVEVDDPPPIPVKPKKVHGLEAYELKEYNLVMIVSGTTVNRALILDPNGKQYFVERGFRIGNKGARVQAITQYTLYVQEPDSDKAIKLDIEPPFIGLESKPDSSEVDIDAAVDQKTDLKALFKGLPKGGAPPPPSPSGR